MEKSQGARFTKFKLVYKKAIQEILTKYEQLAKQSPHVDIKEYDLETKLNKLDLMIKDNISVTKDIKNEEYIQEILESYLVEDKFELLKFIQEKTLENKNYNIELENKLKILKDKTTELENECNEKEIRINNLIKGLKNSML
ncbi:hypothetical protein NAPIS_ORF02566 [Vairimorpha apis BRL 01]|uniref:Uncharacterized protein n=1 Tax=Vairimorpha apis BRL 01 TaxID=1037528 RepID=T0L5U0_9MICR|nr:hypothetical protein NAPIS_ORF02566 [Vairimorpha apis BRL 01]